MAANLPPSTGIWLQILWSEERERFIIFHRPKLPEFAAQTGFAEDSLLWHLFFTGPA
jgi:hypothetical protein